MLVQWPIDDLEAERESLATIAELERLGYSRAWNQVIDGLVIWKLVAPETVTAEQLKNLAGQWPH